MICHARSAASSRGSGTLALTRTPSGCACFAGSRCPLKCGRLAGNELARFVARAAEPYYLACSLPNELHDNVVFEWFCEKSDSSRIECGLAHWRIVSSADENDPCLGRISAEASLHFQTVHLRHPYVEECYATSGMFELGEKSRWMVKLLHNKTGRIN